VQDSLWYVVPNTLPVGDLVTDQIIDRQRIGYNITQAVLHGQMHLKMYNILVCIIPFPSEARSCIFQTGLLFYFITYTAT
jgi:hypothetical protein